MNGLGLDVEDERGMEEGLCANGIYKNGIKTQVNSLMVM